MIKKNRVHFQCLKTFYLVGKIIYLKLEIKEWNLALSYVGVCWDKHLYNIFPILGITLFKDIEIVSFFFIIVTERVNHAKDYLETNDLTSYDG